MICVYYYFPLHINVIAQTYKGYEPIKLREDDYNMKEDQVKCLVCSNESDSTYVFLCYPTETRCLSLVKDEMIENHLELNVLGYGTMINNNKVRTFLLFINNEILSFSLLREMSFEKLVRSYLTEIEENDFNLNIARYVQKPLEEETITVEEALKDFKQKLAELEQAEDELEALLAKEGFEL